MIETPFGKQVENGGKKTTKFQRNSALLHRAEPSKQKGKEGGISGSGTVETVPLCRNANSSTESVEGLQTSTQGTLE
jgi:hypothetical protein